MNLHGCWLKNRSEHGDAEPLFRRALEIDQKSFAPDHPKVTHETKIRSYECSRYKYHYKDVMS